MKINTIKKRASYKSEIELLGGISSRVVADGKRGEEDRLELRQCIVRRLPACCVRVAYTTLDFFCDQILLALAVKVAFSYLLQGEQNA